MNQARITRSLLFANTMVYVWISLSGPGGLDEFIDWGANFGPATLGGEWWRLLTATFIHAGVIHLFFNMLALWNLGAIVEGALGSACFASIYFLSGLAGSITSLAWHPHATSVGASGAIFGLFGALIGLLAKRRLIYGEPIDRATIKSFALNIFLNLAISLLPGIDFAAHFGGLIAGLIVGFLIEPHPQRRHWWKHPLLISMYGLTILALVFKFLQ